MFKKGQLMFLFADSALHAGSGRGMGAVDLPIQRERATGLPMVQASGIKGATRSYCEQRAGAADETGIRTVFGPSKGVPDHAGAFSPGDARLLLFPMRSLAGVFAWTTCLLALRRFVRDATSVGEPLPWTLADDIDVPAGKAWVSGNVVVAKDRIVLEEFAFQADLSQSTLVNSIAAWLVANAIPRGPEYGYTHKWLAGRLVVLPDDAFRDFTQFATEINTRIKLSDEGTKVVDSESGALWTEEYLPVDTLLYSPFAATDPRRSTESLKDAKSVLTFLSDHLDGKRIQLGGNETVGRGLVSIRFGEQRSISR